MATDFKILRDKARKEVTNPDTGNSFIIRKMDPFDYYLAQIVPTIGTLPKEEEDKPDEVEKVKDNPEIAKVMASRRRYVLEKCAGVFFGEESEMPEGKIHITWISDDAGWLSNEIFTFCGFNEENAKKIEALEKNGDGSENSTKSGEPSGDSQAN